MYGIVYRLSLLALVWPLLGHRLVNREEDVDDNAAFTQSRIKAHVNVNKHVLSHDTKQPKLKSGTHLDATEQVSSESNYMPLAYASWTRALVLLIVLVSVPLAYACWAHVEVGRRVSDIATRLLNICVYMCFSVGMLCFNKHMLSKGRFPFPIVLVMIHMGCSFLFAFIVFKARPDMFSSLSDPEKQITLDLHLLIRSLLPIVVFFASALVLANSAYAYCSLAFLQMIKETTPVAVFFVAAAVGIEQFSFQKLAIVIMIVLATMVTVRGAISFSLAGVAMQVAAVVCEAFKIISQTLLLTKKGKGLDVLTFVLLVCPLCCLVLASAFFGSYMFGLGLFAIPEAADFVRNWPMLAANACVAFLLNVIIAWFLKNNSPVSVSVIGIVKDILIVFGGILLFSEETTTLQMFGFACQLAMVFTYSMMKMHPDGSPFEFCKSLLSKPIPSLESSKAVK